MINREDMLELTRRMTPKRTSIKRIAGCYVDQDGDFDGNFNTNFLKLSEADKAQSLKLGSIWQLLMAMKKCSLKNDALMDTFYDIVMEHYQSDSEYAILVFHDRYDIPAKVFDKERLGESAEVFEYLICTICPLMDKYEPGDPACRFLFPAFAERCDDLNHVNVFQKDLSKPHMELAEKILGVSAI